MQSFIDILCFIDIGSLFVNLTVNLFTNINPFFSSSVFLGQNKNKWSITKQQKHFLGGLGGPICDSPCSYLIGKPLISFVSGTDVCSCKCIRVFMLSRASCILFSWCSHDLSYFSYNVFNTLISCCKASTSECTSTFLTDSSLL